MESDHVVGVNAPEIKYDPYYYPTIEVAMSASFWQHHRYVPAEIPKEDMNLWIRGLKSGLKFWICDEILLFYRLHEHQVTGNNIQSQKVVTQDPVRSQDNRSRRSGFINPTLL